MNLSALPKGANRYELIEIKRFLTNAAHLDWSPQGDWIAYEHMESDWRFHVYRIRPDRRDNQSLTFGHPALPFGRHMGNPTYHPSGRWIVFQAEKADHPRTQGGEIPGGGAYNDLWAMDLASPPPYRVVKIRDVGIDSLAGSLDAHFSTSGDKLLWTDLVAGGFPWGRWRLGVAGFVTEPEPHLENTRFYRPGDAKQFYEAQDWLADDSAIVFCGSMLTGQKDHTIDIVCMDLATEEWARLTKSSGMDGEPDEFDERCQLTPAGDAIVWMSSAGHPLVYSSHRHREWMNTDLWIMNLDGSDKRKLTHYNDPGYPEYDPGGVIVSDQSWSPDGTRLATNIWHRAHQRPDMDMLHFKVG